MTETTMPNTDQREPSTQKVDPRHHDTTHLYHDSIQSSLYAGFWIRFLSFIIDLLVIFGINALIIQPLLHLFGLEDVKIWIQYFSLEHILEALVFYLYFVLLTKQFKQTLGKMIVAIRVEKADRTDLSWGDVLFREWIGRIISGLFGNLLYLVVAFTHKKRGLHDYFADTVVIRNKFEKFFYEK